MSISQGIARFLMPAGIGAALTFGLLSLNSDADVQQQQILSLENRIIDLEHLLAQKDAALDDARFFGAAAFADPQPDAVDKSTAASAAISVKPAAQALADPDAGAAASGIDRQQILKDLGTRSDRDPRSFAEKATDLLAETAGKESIAIVSKSLVDLADNRELLPDYELEALYQQQTNADLQRVIAQVMSTRGDNRLLEQQIAKTQGDLASENPLVRQQALVELAKTHHASAAKVIAPLLQDDNNSVKLDALLALRATGNQSHVRAAEALVNDPDPAVSWLANDVVNRLQNLSERARTQLASADIVAELPVLVAP